MRTKKNILIIVAILMIPVIVSAAVFSFLLSFLNGSIKDSEEMIFDGIVSTVERDLQNVLIELIRISESSDFRALANGGSVDDSVVKAVQSKINEVKRAGHFVESVSFISNGGGVGGFLLSEMHFADDENFEDKIFFESEFNYGVGRSLFESFLAVSGTNYFLGASNKVSLLKVEVPLFSADICAVVFFNNVRFIQRINEVADSRDRAFFIKDGGGGLLIADKSGDISLDSAPALLNDKKTMRASDNISGLDYYLRISPDYLNGLLLPLRILVSLSVVIIAALLGILIFLLVRRNNAEKSELIKEKESVQAEFEIIKPSALNDIFTRLFTNRPLFDSVENICGKYGLDLIGKRITLLSAPGIELLSEDIDKYFADFEGRYVIDAEKHYYVILTCGGGEPHEETDRKIVHACKAWQSGNVGADISFAVSKTETGPYLLSKQYLQTEDCRSFIELSGGVNEIVFYSKLVDKGEARLDVRYELADAVSHIKQKKFSQAKEKIDRIITAKLSKMDANMAKLKMFAIIDALISELKEATAFFEGGFLKSLDFENRLLQVASSKQLQKEIDGILDALNLYSAENAGKNEWIDGIIEYIKKNYSNPSLNVSFLSEQFNFNLSYLSRMFKKETGVGVFDYIQRERVIRAKEMLLRNMDMLDICQKTGFFDVRAFIRVFKNIEGCTPSQYKRTAIFV